MLVRKGKSIFIDLYTGAYMGDRIFDFNSSTIVNPEAEGGKEAGTAASHAFKVVISDSKELSPETPIMILTEGEEKLPRHAVGVFINPLRGNSFAYTGGTVEANVSGLDKDGRDLNHPILSIDKRFVELERWLGENHVSVRLTGESREEGYCVYKIRAVNPNGSGIQTERDRFLQMVIERLSESEVPEDTDMDEEPEESGRQDMRDLNSMQNYLACARHTLPKNMQIWADRSLNLIKSSTITPEERRHAERALQMVLNIHWKGEYFASIDPVRARQILDEELFGLERVKQRIMETIIQINRTHTLPAYGLLLAGPAGIGKSQLAYAVARILRLPWTSLDMSAIHDSEALTGSPRVYANAKAGRIMEAFTQSGSSNIVFIINELDKADKNSVNGNPADALLTLLDNIGYTDNYIECRIPTNGVYPVATANDKSRISEPLMSRFAVIDIPDYTPEEKRIIFRKFSLPKVLRRMGMDPSECVVEDRAIDVILEKYRDQTGCRDLEQAAEHLAANALYQIETTGVKDVTFDAHTVRRLLF